MSRRAGNICILNPSSNNRSAIKHMVEFGLASQLSSLSLNVFFFSLNLHPPRRDHVASLDRWSIKIFLVNANCKL